MNTRTAWLVYSALRILFFAVPFLALYFIGWHWLLAAVVATLVAVSLSVIFLSKPRQAAADSIQAWRDKDRTPDDVVEDQAADAAEQRTEGAGDSAGAGDTAGTDDTAGTADDASAADDAETGTSADGADGSESAERVR